MLYEVITELPQRTIAALRQAVVTDGRRTDGAARIIVFGCDTSDIAGLGREADTTVIRLPCVGMLPPSFVDFALSRGYADGVMIAGCPEGDCHHRLA